MGKKADNVNVIYKYLHLSWPARFKILEVDGQSGVKAETEGFIDGTLSGFNIILFPNSNALGSTKSSGVKCSEHITTFEISSVASFNSQNVSHIGLVLGFFGILKSFWCLCKYLKQIIQNAFWIRKR